jgi:proteic killer suppression protein
MIVGFRDEWLRAFFVEDRQSRRIPPELESRLFRKLQMVDCDFRSGFAGAAK